ncbi:unnamed protein product [Tilletia caries]|nr:unnamed protein product [Tilletia caries]
MPRKTARERALEDLEALCLSRVSSVLQEAENTTTLALQESSGSFLPLLADSAADSAQLVLSGLDALDVARRQRYLIQRNPVWRPSDSLWDRLQGYKAAQAFVRFRSAVRMEVGAFHALASVLKAFPTYQQSRGGPAAVELQLAVALYRLGHSLSVPEIAAHAGCAQGSVVNYTRKFVEALCSIEEDLIPWASEEEKREAQDWVEIQSGVKEWRNGWCMVDGSHIPLAWRPGSGYDDDFINRKGTFSLNTQFVCLPTSLRIISYVVGPRRRVADSTVYAESPIARAPSLYLQRNEFIWADLGYPLSRHIVKPYGHGASQRSKDIRKFNYWHSHVRIRAEHAIAFIKGRFGCLRALRGFVSSEAMEMRAQDVVVACIAAHNLAMSWDDAARYSLYVEDGLGEKLGLDLSNWWQPSPERRREQQNAWLRREAAEDRRRRRAEERERTFSQRRIDKRRRHGGRKLRERMHMALFVCHGFDWRDTTRASRMKEMTKKEYEVYLAKQEKAARKRARDARRRQAARAAARAPPTSSDR